MITSDGMFGGKLRVLQKRKGYRFSVDAVLLAGLTKIKETDRVVDLGTGCGIVLLMLAFRKRGSSLVGVEVQPDLAGLAGENVRVNGWEHRIQIIEMDFRKLPGYLPPRSFDVVVSNPPYRAIHTGRINPESEKAVARHELMASVGDVLEVGSYLLPRGGRLALVYPASRLVCALLESKAHGFGAKRLTVIHPGRSSPGSLVHIEFLKGGREGLRVTPPFFIRGENGDYTPEMRGFYEE